MRVNSLLIIGLVGAITFAGAPVDSAGQRVAAKVPGSWDVRLYDSSETEQMVGSIPADAFPDRVRAFKRENGAVMIQLPDRDRQVWVLPMDVHIDLPADVNVVCSSVGQAPNTASQRGLSEECDD